MKNVLLASFLLFLFFLSTPVFAEICEYQELHECRDVSGKMHAFNGQIDTECIESGIYNICTAFNHLEANGECYIDVDGLAKCSCTPDVKLFCSGSSVIVTTTSDCSVINVACESGFYCTENDESPYNPTCTPNGLPNLGGVGGSSGGGGGSGSEDSPPVDKEIDGGDSITDVFDDLFSNIGEETSNGNPTYVILIIVVVISIIFIISLVVFLKKHKRVKKKK